jgi:hypothetical protein
MRTVLTNTLSPIEKYKTKAPLSGRRPWREMNCARNLTSDTLIAWALSIYLLLLNLKTLL